MIASIAGKLRRKAADYLVIDVSGVGYQVTVPLSTFCTLPEPGQDVSLHIHTHLREDSLSLFGFSTQSEKDMFLLLMSVSGIGPRLALAILSSLPVSDLTCALQTADDSKLCAIPGIGKKTAARMVLELQDKIHLLTADKEEADWATGKTDVTEDAVSALVNLGYKRQPASEVVKKIKARELDLSFEAVIRESLRVLMKR